MRPTTSAVAFRFSIRQNCLKHSGKFTIDQIDDGPVGRGRSLPEQDCRRKTDRTVQPGPICTGNGFLFCRSPGCRSKVHASERKSSARW